MRRGGRMPASETLTRFLSSLLLRPRRPQVAVEQFLSKRNAVELGELDGRLDAPVQRHTDLPRPRKHGRVLDRRLVPHVIRSGTPEPFHDMKCVAGKIP